MSNLQKELEAEYAKLRPTLDIINDYRQKHGEAQYFLIWMEGMRRGDEAARKVEEARQDLKDYWRKVKRWYEQGELPLPRAEFLSGKMVCSGLLPPPSPHTECSGDHHWLRAFSASLDHPLTIQIFVHASNHDVSGHAASTLTPCVLLSSCARL